MLRSLKDRYVIHDLFRERLEWVYFHTSHVHKSVTIPIRAFLIVVQACVDTLAKKMVILALRNAHLKRQASVYLDT